ncbi:MAG TPA: ubiquinone/menaquinone biosynthesis methyltransferase [Bacteroides sp.]|nr:ubiquinone/menaquinone biosynthesis methyltransferase [Bacteroides sp.]
MGRRTKDYPLKTFYGKIHGQYDRVNRIFTFGRDASWRRKAAAECLKVRPIRILDLCTGTGDFLLELARQANSPVELTGYDFSASMLELARKKSRGLEEQPEIRSLNFVEGDVADMPFQNASFDAIGITFGIRNLLYENSGAGAHLSEIHRVLRPGGRLVILESSRPGNFLWRQFNALYLRLILPYLGGLLTGNLAAYRYLAQSSKNYYTRDQMIGILKNSGFRMISEKPLFLGSVMLLAAEKTD